MQLVMPQIEERAEGSEIRRFPIIVDAMRSRGVVSVLYFVVNYVICNHFVQFTYNYLPN